MKSILPAFGLCALVSCIWLERPVNLKTPAADRPLSPGERNPPLRQVGDIWPIVPGTPLWFHPDKTSYATVLETDAEFALLALNVGGSNWVHRKHLAKAWLPETSNKDLFLPQLPENGLGPNSLWRSK